MNALRFPVNPVNGQLFPNPPIKGVNVYRYDAAANTWRYQGESSGVVPGTFGDNVTCVEIQVNASGEIVSIENRPIPIAGTGETLGLSAAGEGLFSVDGLLQLIPPYGNNLGGVKQGSNVEIGSDGSINVNNASLITPGVVQLNNTLTSTSTAEALTALQGKILQDRVASLQQGALVLCGSYNAKISQIDYVTAQGKAHGYVVGENLPEPSEGKSGDFFIVSTPGTPKPPAPSVLLAPGDWLVCDGEENRWFDAPVGRNIIARQVEFDPYGAVTASNVQDAIEKLADLLQNIKLDFDYVDDISDQFNGVATTFPLEVNGQPLDPGITTLIVSVGGVLQSPGSAFFVSGSNITFSEPPIRGATFVAVYAQVTDQGGGGGGSVTRIDTGTGLTGGPITTVGTISLVPATTSRIGGVIPDGETIKVDANGVIRSTGGGGGGGTVTEIDTGIGLIGGPITDSGTIALANTTVVPGSYTNANIVVDSQGRITSASDGQGGGGGSVNFGAIDDISAQFDGVKQKFTLKTLGKPLPAGINSQQVFISLGGVLQYPVSSYTLLNGEITFADPPKADYTFSGRYSDPAVNDGTVTEIETGAGLTGGPITTTGTIALANTSVKPGTYSNPDITVDETGRITAASSGTGGGVQKITVLTPLTGGVITDTGTLGIQPASPSQDGSMSAAQAQKLAAVPDTVGTNSVGNRTISSSLPSGGNSGDIWYVV